MFHHLSIISPSSRLFTLAAKRWNRRPSCTMNRGIWINHQQQRLVSRAVASTTHTGAAALAVGLLGTLLLLTGTTTTTSSSTSSLEESFTEMLDFSVTKVSKHAKATTKNMILAPLLFQLPTTKLEAPNDSDRAPDSTPTDNSEESSSPQKQGLVNVDGDDDDDDNNETTLLLNWSGTHSVQVRNDRFWEPESIAEVQDIVAYCYTQNIPLRPVGSALSPNGIAFCDSENEQGGGAHRPEKDEHLNTNRHNDKKDTVTAITTSTSAPGLISLANLDRIIKVNTKRQTVTVQAGARVAQVVEALRPYQLTLPNLASIAEQQMGGFVQVGAHGTGRTIAPVDHYVTKLKLVTPGPLGTITLTREKHGVLFDLAKVGLGCLGVVVEVTMQCVPAHYLREHTYCLSRQEAMKQIPTLLKQHKHIRYMWIPYTDTVVVVTNDPVSSSSWASTTTTTTTTPHQKYSHDERFQPLRQLLLELQQQEQQQDSENDDKSSSTSAIEEMGFGDLRDAILAYDPLDVEHVKRCNQAEAEFWKRSEGYQTKPSDQLLQFDCGGQQWVLELCFPTGSQEESNGNDMKFMTELLEGIERQRIPAHSPIEQRWTASSSSYMSPAHGPSNGLHAWVGIINYLPPAATEQDEQQRRNITKQFQGPYCDLMRSVGTKYKATSHWAKLELPETVYQLVDLRLFLHQRFPVQQFNQARAMLDPKNIMANHLINQVLGSPVVARK